VVVQRELIPLSGKVTRARADKKKYREVLLIISCGEFVAGCQRFTRQIPEPREDFFGAQFSDFFENAKSSVFP
jgi:hypothetical protein